MTKKAKIIFIIIAVAAAGAIASFVDGIIRPEYLYKCLTKLCLFPALPMLYFIINRDERALLRKMFVPGVRSLLLAAALGVGVFAVVMGAFLILRPFVDFTAFAGNLTQSAGITAENFIFVFIYICIINSFFEEILFRGLGFIALKRHLPKSVAYLFSSAIFALYHTGMTAIWFKPWQFLLMLLGLFLGGLIFDHLDDKAESIYPSWLCHLFANLATNTIGFLILS